MTDLSAGPAVTLPRIGVIVGSTRTTRFADHPLQWLGAQLDARADLSWEAIDLREFQLPAYDAPVPPALAHRIYSDDEVARLGAAIDRVDGFIVIAAEFNHGYPAALKNALDLLFVEFNRKPVTFVGYGNVGGARGIEQLRLVAIELEMAPLRHAIHIMPTTMRAARDGGADDVALFAEYDDRLRIALTDLVWWAQALKGGRG